MEYGTKIRLLYLYQYLLEHTDPDHPQSTAELTKMLKDDYDLSDYTSLTSLQKKYSTSRRKLKNKMKSKPTHR